MKNINERNINIYSSSHTNILKLSSLFSKISCKLDQFSFVDHKLNIFLTFLEHLMFDKDDCKVFITLDSYFSFFLGGTYQCQESYLS